MEGFWHLMQARTRHASTHLARSVKILAGAINELGGSHDYNEASARKARVCRMENLLLRIKVRAIRPMFAERRCFGKLGHC